MTRKFCDICKREIFDEDDCYRLELANRNLQIPKWPLITIGDVCTSCREQIGLAIQRLREKACDAI